MDEDVIITDVYDHKEKIKARLKTDDRGICITIDGYEDYQGQGETILIEYCEGKPRVVVWSDINNQDPTHIIELGEAHKEKRIEYEEDGSVKIKCPFGDETAAQCTPFFSHVCGSSRQCGKTS